MSRHVTHAVAAGLLALLALQATLARAQAGSWERDMEAGAEAYQQGRFAEAERFLQAAVKAAEGFGPDDQRLYRSLNKLALAYNAQRKYAEAERIVKRAVGIVEKTFGPESLQVAISLNNLAGLYDRQGRYAEAEPFVTRALAIQEKALGPTHPQVATSLDNLARIYHAQGKYSQMEPLVTRALAIQEKALGPTHPDVATTLSILAGFYHSQGKNAADVSPENDGSGKLE